MDIEKIISEMTLEEKASLCSGANHWDTKSVERLGVPKVTMSDGPHGLRRQDNYDKPGEDVTTRKAVCFPTAAALAASFDRGIMERLGELLGDECQANDVQMLLGPGVNIKRSPLCGRNFEYFSEDPYLAGEMAASYIKSLQKKGISACVKHFAVNNQEYRRMSCDSVADERTLREIYLPAFEAAVKSGGAKSVMCSYNRINGTYACENKWLLTDILRDEWGFDGMVVTDWGAMNNRVKAALAGLNLEMPSSGGVTDKKLVEAVRSGELKEEALDNVVREFLSWLDWCLKGRKNVTVSLDEHHDEARSLAAQCAVLLKNEDGILPLSADKKIAFIGTYAENPRFQGGGSSHINCLKTESALETAKVWADISYTEMFSDEAALDEEQWQAAVDAAKNADVAVIFAGLPASYESECFDRTHMEIPDYQLRAIEEISAVNPNTAVVLYNGSPVVMPWLGSVKAVLEMYLAGEASGAATADVLFGRVNPSGKLAETFPLRLEDTPAYPDYAKNKLTARYGEGIYVGYRHYDVRKLPVQFPFGFGLSYTTFEMGNLNISQENDAVTVSVDVTNTGNVRGKETVQVYVGFEGEDHVGRAVRELKGFSKVELEPGEAKTVSIALNRRAFSYYETRIHDWYAESGEYTVYVGNSSRDLPLCGKVTISSEPLPLGEYETLTVADLMELAQSDEDKMKVLAMTGRRGGLIAGLSDSPESRIALELKGAMPLHSIKSFSSVTDDEIMAMIDKITGGTYNK
ncbi:MAG: glycoside hydrolase family 3 C-terminal domain-containing protein [Oscillospiraceae bacterium]